MHSLTALYFVIHSYITFAILVINNFKTLSWLLIVCVPYFFLCVVFYTMHDELGAGMNYDVAEGLRKLKDMQGCLPISSRRES